MSKNNYSKKYEQSTIEPFEQSKPEQKYEQSKPQKIEKKFTVIFKENRKFELQVGRETLIWMPHGINPEYCINEKDLNNDETKYRNGIPESILNHSGFKSHKKYFNIKE